MLSDLQELWKISTHGTLQKQSNVNAIDVPYYCEQIGLAISRSRNVLQPKMAISNELVVDKMPFRIASSLYYTTLRIHELQVNSLLDESKLLVAQSNFKMVISLAPTKRKLSCSGTRKILKRRRIVKSTKDTLITNYVQLLDEAEDLLELSKSENAGVCNEISIDAAAANASRVHIREITISKEIEERYEMGMSDGDEEGFGDATLLELNELFQCYADENGLPPTKNLPAIKRKVVEEDGFIAKQAKLDEGNLTSQKQIAAEFSNNNSQKTNTPDINANFLSDDDYQVDISAALAILDEDNELPKQTDHNIFGSQTLNAVRNSQKKRKLIIDEATMLTNKELCDQMQSHVDINRRIIKSRAKIKWRADRSWIHSNLYVKTRQSADKLLSNLSRSNNLPQNNKLKQKLHIAENVTKIRYHNLLRDIFAHEVDERTANEIYSNCKINAKQKLSSKKKKKLMLLQALPDIPNDLITDICSSVDNNQLNIDNINNNNENGAFLDAKDDKWNTSDVMIRILELYRGTALKQHEIDIAYILPTAMLSRKEAARGFFSLLALAAKKFIKIISPSNTIHCEKISLGTASTKLIIAAQKSANIESKL